MIDVMVRVSIDGAASVLDAVRAGLSDCDLMRAREVMLAESVSRVLAEAGSCVVSAAVEMREEPRPKNRQGSTKHSAPDGIRNENKISSSGDISWDAPS